MRAKSGWEKITVKDGVFNFMGWKRVTVDLQAKVVELEKGVDALGKRVAKLELKAKAPEDDKKSKKRKADSSSSGSAATSPEKKKKKKSSSGGESKGKGKKAN